DALWFAGPARIPAPDRRSTGRLRARPAYPPRSGGDALRQGAGCFQRDLPAHVPALLRSHAGHPMAQLRAGPGSRQLPAHQDVVPAGSSAGEAPGDATRRLTADSRETGLRAACAFAPALAFALYPLLRLTV